MSKLQSEPMEITIERLLSELRIVANTSPKRLLGVQPKQGTIMANRRGQVKVAQQILAEVKHPPKPRLEVNYSPLKVNGRQTGFYRIRRDT